MLSSTQHMYHKCRLSSSRQKRLLRQKLNSESPVVLAGAHNALTARLVEEAGFDGVWASGYEISASHGVPDAGLLGLTDVLEAARLMKASVDIPIIADCDTGFGNAINCIHATIAFERAGIAGICIEDNVFPKRCSFYVDVRRELEPVEEQVLKIRAALEAKETHDFMIIARTEALVAGKTVAEALKRASAYAEVGADAVLVHSKHSTAEEVTAFANAWNHSAPLVCVPTTYGGTTIDDLQRIGYKMVIFANHGLRASVSSAQRILRKLREAGTPSAVEDEIASMSEVDRIVGVDGLKEEERRYSGLARLEER